MNMELFRQAVDRAIQSESTDNVDMEAEELPADMARLATAYRELTDDDVTTERITEYVLSLNTDNDLFTYQQAYRRVNDDYNHAILDRHPQGLFFRLSDAYDEDAGRYDEIQYADLFLLTA